MLVQDSARELKILDTLPLARHGLGSLLTWRYSMGKHHGAQNLSRSLASRPILREVRAAVSFLSARQQPGNGGFDVLPLVGGAEPFPQLAAGDVPSKPAGTRELTLQCLSNIPCRRPSGEQGSILLSRSGMGGRSESRARSYAPGPESRDGTLQVSRAGNAGKSLTTQSSIRPG